MAILTTGRHTFEVVNDLPAGYIVWNIGRHNFQFEGYIPLCQADDNYNVNTKTLKALKVKSEEFALEVMNKSIKLNLSNKELKQLLKKGGEQ